MNPQTIPFSPLSPGHRKRLEASGIGPRQVEDRGYRTVASGAELGRLGFGRDQRQTPALQIPIFGVGGKTTLHQIRPDRPRLGKGREIKYETPAGFKLRLDVPPGVLERVLDRAEPLLITEGVLKADSAATRGVACLASLGVHGWEGDVEAWDAIPLDGRPVFIAFDSDVRHNRHVHRAAVKLASFLKARKADVKFLLFPEAPDGSKVGLDDFLVANQGTDELFALAAAELPALPSTEADGSVVSSRYESTDDGIFKVRVEKGAEVRTRLTNFGARIVAELVYVENPLKPREFLIEVRLKGRVQHTTVVADEYELMNWVVSLIGAGAIIEPGRGIRDEVRAAIQLASGEIRVVPTYDRTGWVEIEGGWCFLHADGAIHADSSPEATNGAEKRNDAKPDGGMELGQAVPKAPIPAGQGGFPEVRVRLSPTLSRYRLPRPSSRAEHVRAVQTSLAFLELAPDKITFPLYAFLWRVLIDTVRYSLFLDGTSGIGKSELAALIVQHVGPEMDNEHLPESFASTANALAATGHEAAYVPLVVDDYVPTGSNGKIQRTRDQAETVIRNQGNRAGRNRCTRDGSTLGGREPRCGFLFTGEEAPEGVSLGARYFDLQVERGDILDPTNPSRNERLGDYQQLAREGRLALATTGFLQAVAPRLAEIRREIAGAKLEYREVFRRKSSHPRVVDNAADLLAGLSQFLYYACRIDAIDQEEHDGLWLRAHQALFDLLKDQETHQVEQDPARRLFELLISALATGRAHLRNELEDEPDDLGSHRIWGYEARTIRVPSRPDGNRGEPGTAPDDDDPHEEVVIHVPRGDQVGWRRGDQLYLEPARVLGVVQRMATDGGQPPIPLGKRALGKRLAERNLLDSKEADRNTKKVPLEGVMKEVWHVSAYKLYEFFRSWESWEEDRNEEHLREFEEFVRRKEQAEAERIARKKRAHDFIQEHFGKLIDPAPAPKPPSQESTESPPEHPRRADAPEPGRPSVPPPPTPDPSESDEPRRPIRPANDEGSFLD